MHILHGSQTDRGRVRTSNEDSFVENGKTGLFLVADGMGGHAAGEIASQLAASSVDEWIKTHAEDHGRLADVLRLGVLEANTRVFDAQRENHALAGMGSTLTAMLFRGSQYCIAHAGDSRAYRLRGGILDQLTRDHSFVWPLYENGMMQKSELIRHPQKNLITRSIGSRPRVDIDVLEGEGLAGDIYLLCSDGLTDAVPEERIREALSDPQKTPREIADFLVAAANEEGGPDNITAVIIKLEPDAVQNPELETAAASGKS